MNGKMYGISKDKKVLKASELYTYIHTYIYICKGLLSPFYRFAIKSVQNLFSKDIFQKSLNDDLRDFWATRLKGNFSGENTLKKKQKFSGRWVWCLSPVRNFII